MAEKYRILTYGAIGGEAARCPQGRCYRLDMRTGRSVAAAGTSAVWTAR